MAAVRIGVAVLIGEVRWAGTYRAVLLRHCNFGVSLRHSEVGSAEPEWVDATLRDGEFVETRVKPHKEKARREPWARNTVPGPPGILNGQTNLQLPYGIRISELKREALKRATSRIETVGLPIQYS